MEVDVAMEEPGARVVGAESDRDIIGGSTDVDNVSANLPAYIEFSTQARCRTM